MEIETLDFIQYMEKKLDQTKTAMRPQCINKNRLQ